MVDAGKKFIKGAVALEFALILPFLLTILFLIFECFWLTTNQMLLNYSVYQGTKSAMSAREWLGESPVDSALQTTKKAFWLRELDDSEIEVNVTENDYGRRNIEVLIPSYPYDPLTGFLPDDLLPDKLAAKAQGELL